jgi:uncharacterized protein
MNIPPIELKNLPIFPLNSVLFPGGMLSLRIFETRYLDMISECMRTQTPFGVCLITQGDEVGFAADHVEVGCLAQITDFDQEQPGILKIAAVGTKRFKVLSRKIDSTRLVRAHVELIAEDFVAEVPPSMVNCVTLLQQIIQDLTKTEPETLARVIPTPHALDSSGWIANRLSEILPVPTVAKQRLMEMPDPLSRLSLINSYLKQQKIV